jgi:hypothetical protein
MTNVSGTITPVIYTRSDLYAPVLTAVVGLTCSVYLFRELEKERVDKRIGKALFACSAVILAYFASKEREICTDKDVKRLYAFLGVASLVVVPATMKS